MQWSEIHRTMLLQRYAVATNSLHQIHAHQDEILVFYNVLCCKAITLERLGLLNALQIFITTLIYFGGACAMACMHLGGQRTICGSWFFSFTTWVLETEPSHQAGCHPTALICFLFICFKGLLYFLKFLFLFCVCMCCLHAYMCITCVPKVPSKARDCWTPLNCSHRQLLST